MERKPSARRGLLSLSSLLVFLSAYVAQSVATGAFSGSATVVAFLVACLFAVSVAGSGSASERFAMLARGASQPGVMSMVWIFVLAGAFSSTASAIGAVGACVSLTLDLLPGQAVLCAVFLATCLVSLSVGTSVGTIAAVSPAAAYMADSAGVPLPLILGVVVGGAYFGDNLSFISDTTVMATTTQGCRMSDKFWCNLRLALPAAAVCFVLYLLAGVSAAPSHGGFSTGALPGPRDAVLALPYAVVLGIALIGADVMLALASGLAVSVAVGLLTGRAGARECLDAVSGGVTGMGDLIVITLLAAGLMQVIREAGGVAWVMDRLTRRVKGRRGAELCVAALVVVTDCCTANNTVAILSVGQLARELGARYGVDPRRMASLLDTFSCTAQGLLPYGAQLLLVCSLTGLSPLDVLPYLYYPLILGGFALLSIFTRHENRIPPPAPAADPLGLH